MNGLEESLFTVLGNLQVMMACSFPESDWAIMTIPSPSIPFLLLFQNFNPPLPSKKEKSVPVLLWTWGLLNIPLVVPASHWEDFLICALRARFRVRYIDYCVQKYYAKTLVKTKHWSLSYFSRNLVCLTSAMGLLSLEASYQWTRVGSHYEVPVILQSESDLTYIV